MSVPRYDVPDPRLNLPEHLNALGIDHTQIRMRHRSNDTTRRIRPLHQDRTLELAPATPKLGQR